MATYPKDSCPSVLLGHVIHRDLYLDTTTFSERGVEWHKIGCVDWDGVIGVFPHPEDGERPVEGAMRGIGRLLESGWYLEIYSAGSDNEKRRYHLIDLLQDWSRAFMVENQISLNSFMGLYKNQLNFPTKKPTAKWYLDDRGVQFTGWDAFTPQVAEDFRAVWQHPRSDH